MKLSHKSHIFELISKEIYDLELGEILMHLGCTFGVSKVSTYTQSTFNVPRWKLSRN